MFPKESLDFSDLSSCLTKSFIKRTWTILAKSLTEEGYAEKATVRQAVKKVAWARNCQLTVSGYAPLEIATDREKNLVV